MRAGSAPAATAGLDGAAGRGRRLKVLFYNHTRLVSGGERVLLSMLHALDRERYELLVACPAAGRGELDRLVREQGIEVVAAPLLAARFSLNPLKLAGSVWSGLGAIARLRGTFSRVAPDLIHANSVRAALVATLATAGMRTRVLWHIHDDLPAGHPVTRAIQQMAYRSGRSRFVAVSQATARAFAGPLPFVERIAVLHNGVDRERFSPRAALPDGAAAAVRAEFGVGAGASLVVCVGLLHPRKGLLELVEAWRLVADASQTTGKQARLVLVGAAVFNQDHVYEAAVRERVRALGLEQSVLFAGPRGDVPAILRAADLLVLNARSEPFALILLEAVASGTPIVATNVSGIPELIEDGVSGVLVTSPDRPEENKASLSRALLDAIEEPARMRTLADRAFVDVLPLYTAELFGQKVRTMYDGLEREEIW